MDHTISILVENEFGVLARVVGLFSGRGFNIESLSVARTLDPSLSRITLVTSGDDQIVEQITKHGIEPDVLLNVNVPNLPHDQIKGVQVTTLGKRFYDDQLIKREDPRGKTYYWIGGRIIRSEGDTGTDVATVAEGYVSVTPIHMDMTNHRLLETLRGWDLRF